MLELAREFVNTLDVESGEDRLAGPGELRDWLAARGLLEPSGRASRAGLHWALELREALRDLLLANNGVEMDEAVAAARLDRAAGRARLTVRFGPDGARLEPLAGGVDGALGRILAIVFAAMADGSWSRLKACRNDGCRWVFYDRARNRSRTWCAMSVCGNRTKARAYRERHASR